MLSGNALTRSTNARLGSNPRARSRERIDSSGTSVVNRRVTSTTTASSRSLLMASTLKAIAIGLKLAASTALAMGSALSATTS